MGWQGIMQAGERKQKTDIKRLLDLIREQDVSEKNCHKTTFFGWLWTTFFVKENNCIPCQKRAMKIFLPAGIRWTVRENCSRVIFSKETKIIMGKNDKISCLEEAWRAFTTEVPRRVKRQGVHLPSVRDVLEIYFLSLSGNTNISWLQY